MTQSSTQNMTSQFLSFKEYISSFMSIKDPYLTDGWGWFIDIEDIENSKLVPLNSNYHYNRPLKKTISIPHTINEISSIKSIENLCDDSNTKILNRDYQSFECLESLTHSLCILAVVGVFYFTIN